MTNHPPSNQRNNKECGMIHSYFTDDCRQRFRNPIAQLSSVVFVLDLMTEDSSMYTLL